IPPVDLDAVGGDERVPDYGEFDLLPGHVLYKSGGGGGGYGDPLDRDPSAVAGDVLQGLVSSDAARDIYGVVMDGRAPDLKATEMARSRLREERSEGLDRRASLPTQASDGSNSLPPGGGGLG